MSDSNPPPSSDKTPWSDALLDFLLRETKEGGPTDEAFLASVEKAIDAESDADSKIIPMPRQDSRRPWLWSSGIAATLLAGVVVVFSFVHLRDEPGAIVDSIIVEPESLSDDFEVVRFSKAPKATNGDVKLLTKAEVENSSESIPNKRSDGISSRERTFSRNLPGGADEVRGFNYLDDDALSIASSGSGETSSRYPVNHFDTAYNQTRSKMLEKIATDWEESVPDPESEAVMAGESVRIGGGMIASKGASRGNSEIESSPGLGAFAGSRIELSPQNLHSMDGSSNFGLVDSNSSIQNKGQIGALEGVVAIGSGGDILVTQGEGSTIPIRPAGEVQFGEGEISVPPVDPVRNASFYDLGETQSPVSGAESATHSNFVTLGNAGARSAGRVEGKMAVTAGNEIALETDNLGLPTLSAPEVGKPAEGNAHSLTLTESLITELTVVGRGFQPTNRPAYGPLIDNPWFSPLDEPLSTFSTDVDTASWTNLRAMIRNGRSADAIHDDAVRIEELINYFDWNYPQPDGEHPFAFATETAECPWNENHLLMRVGIQGHVIPRTERPDANLVFLLDVSGSMNQPNKLPLVKRSISVLIEELGENDSVSIVVYAGAEGLALKPTSGRDQVTIQEALDKLDAGGSTNGGAGIKLAYRMAREQFKEEGINRVILCTDGDFNVGTTGTEELVSLVEKEAESGVFLSVCGFGQDNLNDAMLEEITNKGNGNYSYIDDFREARKVFLQDLMGTLVTIAKDVKIQIEFNPAQVDGYRLIGYANRKLEAEDFENDEIDAGEVGSGHAVTALYEIVPAGAKDNPADEEIALRYQMKNRPTPERKLIPSGELALLKLRYKQPDGERSILMEQPVMPSGKKWERASDDFRFASAVGLFGMILREHESVGDATFADVIEIASKAKGADPQGWRAEFVDLVRQLADR